MISLPTKEECQAIVIVAADDDSLVVVAKKKEDGEVVLYSRVTEHKTLCGLYVCLSLNN